MNEVVNKTNQINGKVYLVGAGPGDVDLLTVKALRLIQSCDVILYDNLVSAAIRSIFPNGCKKFFVGKSRADHSIPQHNLNQLMVTLAKRGLSVCRLKGGDPLIFGRGSEEMLVLHKAGITTELIPGITAASGCTSYAGIPLTHRGVSQGCTFITGHAEKNLDINWSSLATAGHTLVFYMGLSQLPNIRKKLLENGLAKETPAALIENGTHQCQRVVTSTLDNLAQDAVALQLTSPTLIVIGKVVKLREQLAWFEDLSRNRKSLTTDLNKKSRLSA